jgi:DNA-binding beta-propeller fold protein YncE
VIDTSTGAVVKTISGGYLPTLTADGKKLYALGGDSARDIHIVDTQTNAVTVVHTQLDSLAGTDQASVMGMVISPDGQRAYVRFDRYVSATQRFEEDIVVIDATTGNTIKVVPAVQDFPGGEVSGDPGLAISADGRRIYVITPDNRPNDPTYASELVAIDTATNQVVGRTTLGHRQPTDITVSPDGTRVYVVGNSYEVYDPSGGWLDVVDTHVTPPPPPPAPQSGLGALLGAIVSGVTGTVGGVLGGVGGLLGGLFR